MAEGSMKTEFEAPLGASKREDFAELSRRVRERGLFLRRGGYYAMKIPASVAALAALAVIAVIVGNSWWNLTVAAGLAFVLVQIGFIGHDAGHRQVWAYRRGNDVIGLLLANLLNGFSFRWWQIKHTRHHAHTNLEGKDPDIAAGALVFTSGQARKRGRFGQRLSHIQQYLLVPLLFLEALNLHVASLRDLARRRDRAALVELGLLVIHGGIFFVAPFLILSPLRAATFIIVTQALFGFYLGASFLTNHVGMPTVTNSDHLGFLHRQVLTSRNLIGPSFVGFIFGGLDSQIEHHLFPTMPRANLRRARAVVRPFCAEHRIPYDEESLWRAYRDVVRHLQIVGNGGPVVVAD
jgi:fatty acid desaturase